MRLFAVGLLSSLLAVAAPFARAQDSTDDLFSDLETRSEKSAGKSSGGLWDKVRKGLEVSARLRAQSFLYDNRGTDRDSTHNFFETGLDWKYKLSGAGNIFFTQGWIEGGNAPDTYGQIINSPRDLKRTRNIIEVAELYYTREFPGVDVTAGKRTVAMGIGNLYSPSDRLTPQDLNDPSAPKRIGLWQAGADAWIKGVLVGVKILPMFQPSKFPSRQTRWAGPENSSSSGAVDFNYVTSSGVALKDEYPRVVNWRNTGVLGKTKGTFRGWDVFAAGFYGPSPHSVLTRKSYTALELLLDPSLATRYSKVNERAVHVSGGFATTYKKLEFHGETLSQTSPESYDDDFVNSVFGFSFPFDELGENFPLQKITVHGDYAWENLVRRAAHQEMIQSSRTGRAARETWMGLLEFQFSDDLKFGAGTTYDNNDAGHTELFGGEYRIKSGLVFKASLELFDGPSGSNLGRWDAADRLTTSLEYSF